MPAASGDAKRLTQVLLNLVGNAIKFTPAGGSVNVTARRAHSPQFKVDRPDKTDSRSSTVSREQLGEFIEFAVEDTGIGIAAEELEGIFSEFRQVDSSITREYGGSGLGLSIAKRFVELHGGVIWAESQVGQGSVFSFRIPLKAQWEGNL